MFGHDLDALVCRLGRVFELEDVEIEKYISLRRNDIYILLSPL